MISRINAIEWRKFGAEEIPKWIIGLLSQKHQERFKAYSNLTKYFHQYDDQVNIFDGYKKLLSTDAPVLVTPLLMELVFNENIEDRHRIIEILTILVSYKSLDTTLSENQYRRAVNVYDQIFTKFDDYVKFLRNDDQKTRISTIRLLWRFENNLQSLTNVLLHHIETIRGDEITLEEEKIACVHIIYDAIQQNSKYRARFEQTLKKWLGDDLVTLSVCATSAYYLIKLNQENIDSKTVQILANILKLPTYQYLDILTIDECVEAFLEIGTEAGTLVILEIFKEHTDISVGYDLATMLLSIHFGYDNLQEIYESRGNTDRSDLKILRNIKYEYFESQKKITSLQKIILHHLVNKDELWGFQTNLFYLFGLPENQGELRDLLNIAMN